MKRIVPYLRYLRRLTRGFHSVIAARTILGITSVGVMLVFVWFSKSAIDCATGRPTSLSLTTWFVLMVAAMLTDVVLTQAVRYIETRHVLLLTNRINRRLFATLMDAPLVNGRLDHHSGDMLNRLTLDVRSVANFAIIQLPAMIVLAVQLLGAFIFLSYLNPYLALAPVIIMPVCLGAGKLYFRRQRRLAAEIRSHESRAHVTIQEGLQHRIIVRSLLAAPELRRRLATIHSTLAGTNRTQTRLSAISGTMTRVGFIAGYLTAFGWSIFSLSVGTITFGTMTAFLQLVNRIQGPIASISGYLPTFITTSVALDRLHAVDPLDHPIPDTQASTLDTQLGIRLHDVTFRYSPTEPAILTNFSHDFRPGSRTMITGPTGAGKTTLIRLLLGLLTPDSGSIEIYGNNTPPEPISAATLANYAYVPQGNTLLHGTIRDNLLLADPAATDAQLAEVLHIAAADFVFTLPDGLDTIADETGGGLSEGQAQRIAIARALLRPGTILLLDEFNSALDTATAATLMERLATYRTDSTIIIIAHHHTSIAPYCDTILPIPEK